MEAEFPHFLHTVKKFLYYATVVKEYLHSRRIPITYREVERLGLPPRLLKVFDYEPERRTVVEAYLYVGENFSKLVELDRPKKRLQKYA